MRLALFAEMMKGKPWTPATLKAVGGTEGVGVTFLEETFSAADRPAGTPLSPEGGPGRPEGPAARSRHRHQGPHAVARASCWKRRATPSRPRDFDDLIRILDGELRLITPTDPEGDGAEAPASPAPAGAKYYQLTHDYLVPLAAGLADPQAEGDAAGPGRAAAGGTLASWTAKPEGRHLPSVWEWAEHPAVHPRRDWTEPQRRDDEAGGKDAWPDGPGRPGLDRPAVVGAAEARGSRGLRGSSGRFARPRPRMSRDHQALEGLRRWADPELRRVPGNQSRPPGEHLHASMALLADDPSQPEYLTGRSAHRIDDRASRATRVAAAAPVDAGPPALVRARFREARRATLLPAASTLALYVPEGSRWPEHAPKVAELLVRSPLFLESWIDLFRPARAALTPPLAAILRDHDPHRKESEASWPPLSSPITSAINPTSWPIS